MPPTLRSSPASQRTTRNSSKTPISTPEKHSTPTPGKARYCATCKRPRKGHPRTGCPFTDEVDAGQPDGDVSQEGSPTCTVADALDALNLTAADADIDSEGEESFENAGSGGTKGGKKPFARMPGMLAPEPSWMYSESSQTSSTPESTPEMESIEMKRERKPRTPVTPMPGMLAPLPSWIYSQSSQVSCKDESPPSPDASFSSASSPYLGLSQLTECDDVPSQCVPDCVPPPPDPAPHTRSLARTLTEGERAAFTASLAHLAKAAVFVLPAADAPSAAAAAMDRGLSARLLQLDHADVLLIVGHTEGAVAVLEHQVEAKMHALVPPTQGALGAAAKAVLIGAVGAVAAWGALAFA
ncbi:hypothetical protein GGX14DRAFT_696609 [Mycena pura]|uniref:Uncharacterized protein n=1 Tax=Mycena pura TaxID=153505 RepID=A0AAD6VIW3_9AGAR|nr:hypothetical protein GGX14DRAFT_696609 [Mycena pura]